MSSIKDDLLEGMKEAMRKGEKDKLSVIRNIRAAIKNQEIQQRKDFSNDEVFQVLNGEIKIRQKARDEFIKLGRKRESERFQKEINLLYDYFPIQMDFKNAESLVIEIINEIGAKENDLETVVATAMLRAKGNIDEQNIRSLAQLNLK